MRLVGSELEFSYGGRKVLNRVSLEVETGALTMLVGPNGSGKSTLLQLLAGFLRPDRGRVSLDGLAPHAMPWRARARKLAFMTQDFQPELDFSVRETVMLGRNPHLGVFGSPGKADEAAVDSALKDMELEEVAARPVNRLSGGERQRAMMAAVLAQQAECLLLDEPTSALDVRYALKLSEYLRKLREKCGILMVTHDLGLALRHADRVLLISGGATVAYGPTAAVMTPENLERAYGCRAEILHGEHSHSVGFY
ncbi:MAG: ABC transporter ATP-binding protein [Lentisphaeria bacterium]|nr:ABC transporter ATP-binding protein [Lentisphaeria bacterium]